MPQVILIELIYHVVLWLNAYPTKSGVSDTLSPREIILRQKLDFKQHFKARFGAYCKAHDKHTPSNTMVSRLTPAIVLGPTGNIQGTYKVFNLRTGKKIKRRKITVMLMPDTVIAEVERLGHPNADPNMFDFSDRNGVPFEWNDDIDKTPEGISRRMSSSIRPLQRRLLALSSNKTNQSQPWKTKSNPKAAPKTRQLEMPTWSRSTPQKWAHQRSFTPTRMKSTTQMTMMTASYPSPPYPRVRTPAPTYSPRLIGRGAS